MNELLFTLLGAVLAIGGGWISDEIRAWREGRRELGSIKVAIGDELGEIETAIHNMQVVWTEAKVISASSISDLLSNTKAFDDLRPRLFLIKNETLRKKVCAFYKKLKDTVKKSEGKAGSLATTPETITEQTAIVTSFQALETEAKTIKAELEV